jgi:hypothetical protein
MAINVNNDSYHHGSSIHRKVSEFAYHGRNYFPTSTQTTQYDMMAAQTSVILTVMHYLLKVPVVPECDHIPPIQR